MPQQARDTSIDTYRAKRDFAATSEPPPGRKLGGKALRFVVQKHAARRLHWDFRLEHDGVLLSWAVPKGPSLDPADKRLAVRVEDHPLDYADFQGTIPAGGYGAGTVEIWDSGSWAPRGDAAAGLAAGTLQFRLEGKRLSGGFVLVRMPPRGREKAENWLLIKEHDAAERPGGDATALEAEPAPGAQRVGGTEITHADRELWPGLTKRDLATYWTRVAARALPGIAGRPLALLRCPDGIGGQRFFQKHGNRGMPPAIAEGTAEDQPWLAIQDEAGLLACAQISAIELHGWGATLADPGRPDRVTFDLDPGEGVAFAEVVRAARDLRQRLQGMGLESYCRTTGGKGLHLVVPLQPAAGWDAVRDFARDLARAMEAAEPDRFVSTVPKAKRRGRILVDWLRNGAGATAICSYSPRARPGATVATPLAWREVTAKLDPAAFTIATVPQRLAKQKRDPWQGFDRASQGLPQQKP